MSAALTHDEMMAAFTETSALQKGHFQLSSGRHGDTYFQSALVLQHPAKAEQLAQTLAESMRPLSPTVVVGPALDGLIIGWEVARALGVRGIFTERKDGEMQLRRGFEVNADDRIVIIEDVVTTGKSTRETMEALRAKGGEVVGVGSVVDRSGGETDFGVPFSSLLSLNVESWEPADCPLCADDVAITKPGSRPDAKVS